jgi:hypothetical protein
VNADSDMAKAIDLVEASALQRSAYHDELNRSVITLSGRADEIDVEAMISLASDRHVVEISLSKDGWRGTLRSQGSAAFSIEQDSPDSGFSDSDLIEGLRQVEQSDVVEVARYIELLPGLAAEVRVEITNDPSRSQYEWYRTALALERDLASTAWLSVATKLCHPDGRRCVIIHDSGGSWVAGPGLLIQGPDKQPDIPTVDPSEDVQKYRVQRMTGDLLWVPSPRDFAPNNSSGFTNVARLLNGIAEQLVWLWIAKAAWVDDNGVRVRFDGARVVEGPLTVAPMVSATEALTLWDWATKTTDPTRSEALLRSISLVADEPNDLRGIGRQIFVSATSVLEVMVRSQIAEAMEARSSARDAAFTAARGAAEDARAAAAKSFDRVVVQAAAAAGLLLANEQHALGAATTKVLLLVIAGLLVILGVIVLVVDFPSARAGLTAFRLDLDLYRDMLTKADVEDLKAMQSLREASRTIFRAQWLTCAVLAAGLAGDLYAHARVT